MVYGRYNELVTGDYFVVYKPTNITGGPHPPAFQGFQGFQFLSPAKIVALTWFNQWISPVKNGKCHHVTSQKDGTWPKNSSWTSKKNGGEASAKGEQNSRTNVDVV